MLAGFLAVEPTVTVNSSAVLKESDSDFMEKAAFRWMLLDIIMRTTNKQTNNKQTTNKPGALPGQDGPGGATPDRTSRSSTPPSSSLEFNNNLSHFLVANYGGDQ
jgi:hypothetical protein